ncbi:MAG: hypothetical protein IIA45_13630 [Bacteroidetes bacterium]|nr:hypothetical protein [Bacteroidota bacterium]
MNYVKLLLIPVVAVLFSVNVVAQSKIKVAEQSKKMSKGTNPGLTVNIPEADLKNVEKSWKKLMKKYSAKMSNSSGDLLAQGAEIKNISDMSMNVYANISKSGDGINMIVFFDLGGTYLSQSSHATEYKVAEKIVYNFAVKAATEAVEGQLKEAEKALSELEKDRSKLEKENEGLENDIDKYNNSIKNAENTIDNNVKTINKKNEDIANQDKVVADIKERLKKIK